MLEATIQVVGSHISAIATDGHAGFTQPHRVLLDVLPLPHAWRPATVDARFIKPLTPRFPYQAMVVKYENGLWYHDGGGMDGTHLLKADGRAFIYRLVRIGGMTIDGTEGLRHGLSPQA